MPAETSCSPSNLSIFLSGNFQPVKEELTTGQLPVDGVLPAELNGMYVRNGPNPKFAPGGHYHWFDGDGMLHAVVIENGKASYRNRYIRTAAWHEESSAGKALYRGLMHSPNQQLVQAGQSPYKSTANTSIIVHHGCALALSEFGIPCKIGLPNLETIRPDALAINACPTFTAHPKIDPTTGDLFYIRYNIGVSPYVTFGSIDANGSSRHATSVEIPHPIMMHDFAISRNYAVFLDLPPRFDLERTRSGASGWIYDPSHHGRAGVLPRGATGNKVRWFDISNCCVTHIANAWEEGDEVILIGVRYAALPSALRFDPGTDDASSTSPFAYLYQWRFNLKTGVTREYQLDDKPIEFPQINERYTGSAARYIYFAASGFRSGIVKYDVQSGRSVVHYFGAGRYGGEATFVASDNAKAEDDGFLLTYVWDCKTNRSELLVLDAFNLDASPVARVELPVRVPFGFHGTFISHDQIVKVRS